jgi:hypothetical protein
MALMAAVEETIADTMRLLGYESDPRRAYAAVALDDLSATLRKPTVRAVELLIHFLLWRLDPRRANTSFGASFPGNDSNAKASKEFRAGAVRWLREIDTVPAALASPAVLVSPTAAKLVPLLWALSLHVLRCVTERECGIKESSATVVVASSPSSLRLLKAQVVARARMFAEARRAAAEEAESMRRAAAIVDARRRELMAMKTKLEREIASNTAGGGRDLVQIERTRQTALADVLRPEWRKLGELAAAAEELLKVDATPAPTTEVLEVTEFKLPERLQATLAASWATGPEEGDDDDTSGPVFVDGRVDIVSLLRLYSEALGIVDNESKKISIESIQRATTEWATVVSTHRRNLESLETGAVASSVDGLDPVTSLSDLEVMQPIECKPGDFFSLTPPIESVLPAVS